MRTPNPMPRETIAHRGYLVRVSPWTGLVWIEKDGFNIMHCTTRETLEENIADAKRCIDMLLD